MAETLRDELAEKTKAKIIELFGPESALAQAMEDENFLEKLSQLVAWIYGEVMLSQPRSELPTKPWSEKLPKRWAKAGWTWRSSTGTSSANTFAETLRSAIDKYRARLN